MHLSSVGVLWFVAAEQVSEMSERISFRKPDYVEPGREAAILVLFGQSEPAPTSTPCRRWMDG